MASIKKASVSAYRNVKPDFYSEQFSDRGDWCDSFVLKCVLSTTNLIRCDIYRCIYHRTPHNFLSFIFYVTSIYHGLLLVFWKGFPAVFLPVGCCS